MRTLVIALLLAACQTATPPSTTPTTDPTAKVPATQPTTEPTTEPTAGQEEPASEREALMAYFVKRTDEELDAALKQTCEASVDSGKPVLLAFSAEWCPDCRRMYKMGKEAPLSGELAQWELLVVNPGRFDRHEALLKGFDVDRIVNWTTLRPTACDLPATEWPRLQQGVFEPETGEPWSNDQLAAWLQQARSG